MYCHKLVGICINIFLLFKATARRTPWVVIYEVKSPDATISHQPRRVSCKKGAIRARPCSSRRQHPLRFAQSFAIQYDTKVGPERVARDERDKTTSARSAALLSYSGGSRNAVNREAAPVEVSPGRGRAERTHDSVRSLRFEVWPSLCRLPP